MIVYFASFLYTTAMSCIYCRPRRDLASVDHERNFVVPNAGSHVTSIYNDLMIVIYRNFSGFVVYNFKINSTVQTHNSEALWDVAWTLRGHIAYTTRYTDRVVVMSSLNGDVISNTSMPGPGRLTTVSTENVTYLSSGEKGLYQLNTDGRSWKHVFQPKGGWRCWQGLLVLDTFGPKIAWTRDCHNTSMRACRLSVSMNVVDPDTTNHEQSWIQRDVTLPDKRHNSLIHWFTTSLAYDGRGNMFITQSESSVAFVFSANGTFQRQFSLLDFTPHHRSIIDAFNNVLYLAEKRIVSAYKLTYRKLIR